MNFIQKYLDVMKINKSAKILILIGIVLIAVLNLFSCINSYYQLSSNHSKLKDFNIITAFFNGMVLITGIVLLGFLFFDK